MSTRWYYTATCVECGGGPRYFDTKQERDLWSGTHLLQTEHDVQTARTSTPPSFKPNVNCALCIHYGTQRPAVVEVYKLLVCDDHRLPVMIAGAMDRTGDRMEMRLKALGISTNVKPIEKQGDSA